MRAWQRDSYGLDLELAETPTPEPVEGEALVSVAATSLNTADLDLLLGRPRLIRLWSGLRRPRARVPGLDMAGTVEQLGAGVSGLRVGDRVWADMFDLGLGAFAEKVVAPASRLTLLPEGLDFDIAATMPHSASLALQGLGGRVRAGMAVLVNGGGGCVGPFAIQIARASGAEVTGVDAVGKLDLMRAAGATRVVDYTAEDVTLQRGRYDLILDIAATRSALAFRSALRPGGRYVQIARTMTGFLTTAVLGGAVSLFGSRPIGVFAWSPNRRHDLMTLADMTRSGEIHPIIDRVYPMEELPAALQRLANGEARGKLVIHPT